MLNMRKVLIVLILLFLVLASGCVQQEEGIVPAPATEVQVYKGIWLPTSLSNDPNKLDSGMQKLKDIGANTIFFAVSPPHVERCLEGVPPDSELARKFKEIFPIGKEITIANIQAAHRNGLRVGLAMTACFPASEKITLEEWESQVIENAKLAEEYNVELFAPMNEPEAVFGPSASADWGQEILPKIREVYHGKVVWKGAATGDIQDAPTNYSGYDYIGFSIGLGSGLTKENYPQPLEEFSRRVDYALDLFLGFAERDNCTGVMISEFYGRLPERWEKEAWNEELDARANEIVLEKGKGKVVGFFALDFLGLSIFGEDIPRMPLPEKSLKTKEVIKRWFTGVLE
jgi:hypothetical protein